MPDRQRTPTPDDVQRLAQQIEADRALSMRELRRRDHDIGRDCALESDVERLMFWLQRVASAPSDEADVRGRGAVALVRMLAPVLGLLAMLGFMLASNQALVNVLVFLLLFVLLQLLFSTISAVVMGQVLRGAPAPALTVNPARFLVVRALPAEGRYSEYALAGRLLLLRYGQELGALFTLGAMLGFIGALAFVDFSFVWGSTFGLSDAALQSAVDVVSSPWASMVPLASVPADVISETRYQAAGADLAMVSDASRRGWWPFLLMCMAVYALLPRLLLWLASRFAFSRELRRAFTGMPGAEAVLSRMRAPAVTTQALEPEEHDPSPGVEIDESVVLLNWAGAVTEPDFARLDGLARVAPDNRHTAGLGAPGEDESVIAAINRYRPETLLVAVRGWEPPLADLGDVLADIEGVSRCSICLVPLPGKEVGEHNLEEWAAFGRDLSVPAVHCEALYWR